MRDTRSLRQLRRHRRLHTDRRGSERREIGLTALDFSSGVYGITNDTPDITTKLTSLSSLTGSTHARRPARTLRPRHGADARRWHEDRR
nr:hypothetical protein SHINE37_44662 [Rhizobiaceae bacterium]